MPEDLQKINERNLNYCGLSINLFKTTTNISYPFCNLIQLFVNALQIRGN